MKPELWVIGGAGPNIITGTDVVLGEVWVLDVEEEQWRQQTTSGHADPILAGHTAALLGSSIFVYGGIHHPFSTNGLWDLFALDTRTAVWALVACVCECANAGTVNVEWGVCIWGEHASQLRRPNLVLGIIA